MQVRAGTFPCFEFFEGCCDIQIYDSSAEKMNNNNTLTVKTVVLSLRCLEVKLLFHKESVHVRLINYLSRCFKLTGEVVI